MAMDSRRAQWVVWNDEQGLSDSEKLQARNNIGAAALASLAASFESRAPSYNWNTGEVCTYGGALWMFDADHSGAWTGADAHEVSIFELISNVVLYKQPSEYFSDWEDVTSEFSNVGNFRPWRYGAPQTIKIEFSKMARLIHFVGEADFVSTTSLSQNDWNIFLKYNGNKFLTSDTTPAGAISLFYGYPIGNRRCGSSIFNGLGSTGVTIGGFALCQSVVGGFGMKPSINYNASTFLGIELTNTYWNVIPR